MSVTLIIRKAGPGLSIQDQGRPGYLAYGLSCGGAADLLALAEGAAILGNSAQNCAIELAGSGGEFEATGDLTIALTGADMAMSIDGKIAPLNTSVKFGLGQRLVIGAAPAGVYGYLHVAGMLDVPQTLGAQSAHLNAGIGTPLATGDRINVTPGNAVTGLCLNPDPWLNGGKLRAVASLQTHHFARDLERFQATEFYRDPRANRMGVRLASDGPGFEADGGLALLSEIIVPGDIQITGDGAPYILMSECQTTGGYPRIGTIIPADMAKVAQAPVGASFHIQFVGLGEAIEIEREYRAALASLRISVAPRARDPHDIADLLSYQLIGGVTAGEPEPESRE